MKKARYITICILILALVLTSVPSFAANLEVVLNSVKLVLNGKTQAEIGDSYKLSDGTEVPYSILYNGTTYLPLRKVSEIFNSEIGWNNDTRTVSLSTSSGSGHTGGTAEENCYELYSEVPDFGKLNSLKTASTVYTACSTIYVYDATKVTEAVVSSYSDILLSQGFEKNTEHFAGSVSAFKKGNIEVMLDPQIYTSLVYCITVTDLRREPCANIAYYNTSETIPSFSSIYAYNENYTEKGGAKIYTYSGSWAAWAVVSDYARLLENCGFKCMSTTKGEYGNIYLFSGKGGNVNFGMLSNGFPFPIFNLMVVDN